MTKVLRKKSIQFTMHRSLTKEKKRPMCAIVGEFARKTKVQ
jgi:hypothetical protein